MQPSLYLLYAGPIDGSRTVIVDFTDPLIAVGSEFPMKVIPKDSYGNEVDISQKPVLLNIIKV